MPDSSVSEATVLGSANAVATMGVSGYGGVAFQIQGTFSGTITFEGSVQGSEFKSLRVVATDSSSAVTTATTTGVYVGSAVGLTTVRARMSSYSSGGASVLIRADVASPGGSGGGGGVASDVNLADVGGAAIALGQTTMSASLPVTMASDQGPIDVAITGGGGGGTASAFGAAFPTDGTAAGVKDPDGTMQPLSAETLDYDSGAGTVPQTVMGIALPGSGGPVAGGTSANPVVVGQSTATSLKTQAENYQGGTAVGTGNPLQVTLANTGANSTAVKVTGAGTAGSADTGVQTVQGIASMTPLLVTPAANSAVNLAQVGGTNTVTGGTNGTQAVGGIQAHDAADSGNNPVKVGAKATNAEPAAVSASGDIANLITDLVGKLIVLPYANPENFVSGAITSAMTGTTSTSLVAAPASGLRNYITQITVSNGSTTVPTDILIQDGSGGTTLYVIPAPAGTGTGTGASGATLTFPTPLRQPTTATALYCANVTTGASTKVSASGYKGA